MKKYAGLIIGVGYLIIAMAAFKNALGGWDAGHGDLGFWWTVIAVLLSIAGLGALGGTWIHAWTHPHEEPHSH